MILPDTIGYTNETELRTTLEDRLIKSLNTTDLTGLKKVLRQLAEIGTTKALQYLERFDNKGIFPQKIFDFTKAIIASRHSRPYHLELDNGKVGTQLPPPGSRDIDIDKADGNEVSNIIEHHLNTSYNFNLHGFNGYTINSGGEELLLLLDNGRDSKLYNTLLDRKSMVGLVYCHCTIRLSWCLFGLIFTEPVTGGFNFNVLNPDGDMLLKGNGIATGKSIRIFGTETSKLKQWETGFELAVKKNELSLVSGWSCPRRQLKNQKIKTDY